MASRALPGKLRYGLRSAATGRSFRDGQPVRVLAHERKSGRWLVTLLRCGRGRPDERAVRAAVAPRGQRFVLSRGLGRLSCGAPGAILAPGRVFRSRTFQTTRTPSCDSGRLPRTSRCRSTCWRGSSTKRADRAWTSSSIVPADGPAGRPPRRPRDGGFETSVLVVYASVGAAAPR